MKIYTVIAAIFLAGCSASSEDSSAPETTNSSGFPEVSGTYAFTTGNVGFTCSDGSSGSIPPISNNAVISQINNVITIAAPPGTNTDIPGITVIEEGDNKGTVTTSGNFTTSKLMTAYFDQLALNGSIQYSLTGSFSNSGWSGNYRFIVTFTDIFVSCDYTTTFSGSKVNTNLKIKSKKINNNINYESEYYLEISKIGTLF